MPQGRQLTARAAEVGATIKRLLPEGVAYMVILWDDTGDLGSDTSEPPEQVYEMLAQLRDDVGDVGDDVHTFTVQIRATGSLPPCRLLDFSVGKPVVLRDNSLFAARATQEMGQRFTEFLGGLVRRARPRAIANAHCPYCLKIDERGQVNPDAPRCPLHENDD